MSSRYRRIDWSCLRTNSYESRGGDAELHKCERELEQHDSVISDAKKRFSALQTQIARIDQNQADSKAILRGFQDNLRVRIERRALKDIEDEIETLDEHGARNAYVKFETQYNEQRKKQTELQSEVRFPRRSDSSGSH